mmetsp:Transcript_36551/g.91126  ORF Transcript_36551/g.91126 Transcript_36551/m.91126 type:complete len:95 (-) Transcript_36551:313-597(-)
MFKMLEKRLRQAPPSVDAMMEGVSEGVPRPCIEIVRSCLVSAAERPSPEDVAAVFKKAYNDAIAIAMDTQSSTGSFSSGSQHRGRIHDVRLSVS